MSRHKIGLLLIVALVVIYAGALGPRVFTASPIVTATPGLDPPAVREPPVAPVIESQADFHGYACEGSCSGHQAGYDWAEEKGITDPDDCPYMPHNSLSFTEGCWAEAGREGP